MLTPYIVMGKYELARNISRVSITEKLGFTSHAGFFTVNIKHNSNLYLWYFPAFNKDKAAPVILWLQGGPGGSSLFGLFTENGPLIAKKDGFVLRKHHWALKNHLIFIDNPVGTGFSFTKEEKGYCTDEQCVANGLYMCLEQFFIMFPALRNNEFYITGESYAGKYIPSLAMKIHLKNKEELKINLKGLALGNAYCDPINQMDYGNYLYQHGLIDFEQNKLFTKMQSAIVDEIRKENWVEADILMDQLMDGEQTNYSYFKNFTGFENYYNILDPTDSNSNMGIYIDLLNNDEIRESVHVGGLPFNSGKEVQEYLMYDVLKSVAPYISELLSHYRLLFYNGQLDIIVAYPLTESFLRNLNFSSAKEYKTAARHIWRVDDEIAGYVKKAGNLTEVLVRNAGHMVPHDQPIWALDLITRFIKNTL
uniref:Carboxypeptidase n=1 Tax=Pararge aegeria TaxID=116150 RepID=S4PEN0_9NEOP